MRHKTTASSPLRLGVQACDRALELSRRSFDCGDTHVDGGRTEIRNGATILCSQVVDPRRGCHARATAALPLSPATTRWPGPFENVVSRQHRFRNRKKLTNKSGSLPVRHGPVTLLPQLGAPLGQRTCFVGGHMRKYGWIKLSFAAVMLTSASAASEAADVSGGPAYLPPPPPIPFVYNWTGFYAGAHVGAGWSDGDGS